MAFNVTIPTTCPKCGADQHEVSRFEGYAVAHFECGATWRSDTGAVLEHIACLRAQIKQLTEQTEHQATTQGIIHHALAGWQQLCADGVVAWSLVTKERMEMVECMIRDLLNALDRAEPSAALDEDDPNTRSVEHDDSGRSAGAGECAGESAAGADPEV